jgi:hypothetical protein
VKILSLATLALALLCLAACYGDPASPRCRTSVHSDTLLFVAGADTLKVPTLDSITVCR